MAESSNHGEHIEPGDHAISSPDLGLGHRVYARHLGFPSNAAAGAGIASRLAWFGADRRLPLAWNILHRWSAGSGHELPSLQWLSSFTSARGVNAASLARSRPANLPPPSGARIDQASDSDTHHSIPAEPRASDIVPPRLGSNAAGPGTASKQRMAKPAAGNVVLRSDDSRQGDAVSLLHSLNESRAVESTASDRAASSAPSSGASQKVSPQSVSDEAAQRTAENDAPGGSFMTQRPDSRVKSTPQVVKSDRSASGAKTSTIATHLSAANVNSPLQRSPHQSSAIGHSAVNFTPPSKVWSTVLEGGRHPAPVQSLAGTQGQPRSGSASVSAPFDRESHSPDLRSPSGTTSATPAASASYAGERNEVLANETQRMEKSRLHAVEQHGSDSIEFNAQQQSPTTTQKSKQPVAAPVVQTFVGPPILHRSLKGTAKTLAQKNICRSEETIKKSTHSAPTRGFATRIESSNKAAMASSGDEGLKAGPRIAAAQSRPSAKAAELMPPAVVAVDAPLAFQRKEVAEKLPVPTLGNTVHLSPTQASDGEMQANPVRGTTPADPIPTSGHSSSPIRSVVSDTSQLDPIQKPEPVNHVNAEAGVGRIPSTVVNKFGASVHREHLSASPNAVRKSRTASQDSSSLASSQLPITESTARDPKPAFVANSSLQEKTINSSPSRSIATEPVFASQAASAPISSSPQDKAAFSSIRPPGVQASINTVNPVFLDSFSDEQKHHEPTRTVNVRTSPEHRVASWSTSPHTNDESTAPKIVPTNAEPSISPAHVMNHVESTAWSDASVHTAPLVSRVIDAPATTERSSSQSINDVFAMRTTPVLSETASLAHGGTVKVHPAESHIGHAAPIWRSGEIHATQPGTEAVEPGIKSKGDHAVHTAALTVEVPKAAPEHIAATKTSLPDNKKQPLIQRQPALPTALPALITVSARAGRVPGFSTFRSVHRSSLQAASPSISLVGSSALTHRAFPSYDRILKSLEPGMAPANFALQTSKNYPLVMRAMAGAPAAPVPTLPTVTNSVNSSSPSGGVPQGFKRTEIAQLANRVYDLLVRRLADEKQRRGQ